MEVQDIYWWSLEYCDAILNRTSICFGIFFHGSAKQYERGRADPSRLVKSH